jgi:hypothetical protein
MPVYRTRPTIRLSDRGFGRTLSGGKIAQSKRAVKLKARKLESKKAADSGLFVVVVGRDGIEPSTNWLKANCSTAELTPRNLKIFQADTLRFERIFTAPGKGSKNKPHMVLIWQKIASLSVDI